MIMKFNCSKTILLFLTWFMAGNLLAQQPSLSLSEAIQTGLQNNFDILIEKKNLEITRNNNAWGEANRYPNLSFDVNQNNSLTDINNPASFLQGQTISQSLSPSINLNWMLFNGFAVRINKERLEYLQRQSLGNVSLVIENTIQAIILAYYTAVLEQERLDVLEKVLSLSRDRYDYALLKGEIGSAVTFDILQDKNAYLTDSSNLVVQQVNVRNAYRNLNLLMGVEVSTTFDLADELDPESYDYAYEDLKQKMNGNNQSLQNQFINRELQQTNVMLQRSALYPSLSLNLGAAYNFNWQNLNNAEFRFPDIPRGINLAKTINYSANFALSYTLFDGGRIKRAIENAHINEQLAAIQIEQLQMALENDLLSAFDLYEVRKKLLSITEENLTTADLNLSLAQERYKNGTINSFDYRLIQVDYLNIALNYFQAKYNIIDSNSELLRLTGGIISEYQDE